eukprot:CAMPEP_0117043440 /NCGR_PEP_ID=MMETSP0472-20121206/30197_1 /TAXON_ID=693140 ORGANISM="Tiarina fusus, Strain LIS" /NCGR_SAMPLE_ID=MMETSP0472 /ASSEMBLY_ACC=CAM_ASM_000603 /LENGTH=320 /DNA_ID=CAMNT_0004754965 /DNA_START=21 /DNA_END=983 /DNA_ORIENTATION=-
MPFVLRGTLKGHSGAVTCLATNSETPDVLISGSRDKTIISWNLSADSADPEVAGIPKRSLQGHSHFVEDLVLSSDGAFALSCSWDRTLRLWNLATGETTNSFVGHDKDVLSCAFSADNRQIISGSRDRSLKLWNILGECKATIGSEKANSHTEWVSCVRFSPNPSNPLIISCGWDKAVKVWDLKGFGNSLKYSFHGHTGYVNTVAVSPDGSICASGGKDGNTMLWDLNEGSHLYNLVAGGVINALEFSPSKYWLCAATDNGIRVWDLESRATVCDLTDFEAAPSFGKRKPPCTSLAWSADGRTLFAGYADHIIRVWEFRE